MTTAKRYVTVKFTTELVFEVPLDFDIGEIDYWLNEGTRCASNTIDELSETLERQDAIGALSGGTQPCCCMASNHEYLRESTPEDLERCAIERCGEN
jgi:hypothetical protein